MSWSPYTKPMCYWTLNTVLHCCWEFREHWTTKGLIKFRKDDGISSPCLREQAWRIVFSALVSSFTSWEKPCNFSEEKKRRPEIHLRFAGYSSPSITTIQSGKAQEQEGWGSCGRASGSISELFFEVFFSLFNYYIFFCIFYCLPRWFFYQVHF